MRSKIACLGMLWFVFQFSALAQQSLNNKNPKIEFETALDLFEKEQYFAARQLFREIQHSSSAGVMEEHSVFYQILCDLYLQEPGSSEAMKAWMEAHPGHPLSQIACFQMGRSSYASGDYSAAGQWFDQVNPEALSASEAEDFWFESSHTAFLDGNPEKAAEGFSLLVNGNSRYRVASRYYVSHIDFSRQRYEEALKGFESIENDEQFKSVIPYYISQIYFSLGQYDRVVEYAIPRADQLSPERREETLRVIGTSYFKTERFGQAIPYLENYIREKGGSDQDNYSLGLSYYRTGQFDDALIMLEKIIPGNNGFGQNVFYHLGALYLKSGNKTKAAQAFSSASKMEFDAGIQEDALFNYSVLVYELGYSPFNEVTRIFEEYLRRYPNSSRRQEVYRYLADAYLSSKNYQSAMVSLDKIPNKDDGLKKATQRVAFFLGLNRFNDLQFSESIVLFDKSLQYSHYDPSIAARATFWKAEALYRSEDYSSASALFQRFTGLPGATMVPEYEQAFYNLGYSFFRQKEYAKALSQFRRYVGLERTPAQQKVADAWNRIGDCQFMAQAYSAAAESYEKSAGLGGADPDYALFQQGFCFGLQQQHDKKIAAMDRLMANYPASSWIPAAIFETGRAYVVSGRPDPAIAKFQDLTERYSESSYAGRAYLELALIAFNRGRNEEAIRYYKTVVSRFPNTEDARAAMLGLRTVYSDMNEGETFLAYAATLEGSMGDISASEQETISFRSAQNLYIQKDYARAVPGLVRYLERFPNGSFSANARYFLADCYVRSGDTEQALSLYEQVASSRNSFTEESLLASARMRYQKEEWQAAMDLYRRLGSVAEIGDHVMEARVGEMRCAFRLGQYEAALSTADTLLRAAKISDEIQRESGFIKAKSLSGLQRDQEALEAFRTVAREVKSIEGAESKFRLIEILYNQRKVEEASEEVFDFVSKNSGHSYWLARSFLILSDIYIIKKDLFQASETLKSIIDNYDNTQDGIIQMAREKKTALESIQ